MHYYWAFGLSIVSEIDFPELYKIQPRKTTDIKVLIGTVPAKVNASQGFLSDQLTITPNSFFFSIAGVASYYVENGTTITIAYDLQIDMKTVRLFCLSNAFAALMHQRNMIPLHAAAFVHDEELVLLMGESGSGKSTTLAALINKGFIPFSDDICVPYLNKSDKAWYAYSSYPMMKYWADTFKRVDIGNAEAEKKIRPAFDKYAVYFHESFIAEPRKIKLLILLDCDPLVEDVRSSELIGMKSFEKIVAQAYRKEYLAPESLIEAHFIQASTMAKDLTAISISRPTNLDSIASVVNSIESVLITSKV